MADQPPCRRRFQFRLRTLMVGVTIFCIVGGYVAHEAKIVQERRIEWKRSVKDRQVDFRNEDEFGVLNWTRRALGDKVVYIIYVPQETERDEIARLHAIFPEGRIRLVDSKNPGHTFVAPDLVPQY
jgi:hypothetical protein